MDIFVSGVNYKTTPLEMREMLSFRSEDQKEILENIFEFDMVKECVILCTCNRTEIYIYSENNNFDNSDIENAICEFKGLNLHDFKKYFYSYNGINAVKHLFKVACGLESLVLGEDQILGQVKNAYHQALEIRTSSSILNTLFRSAVTAAKKIKTNTELSKNSLSISSLAVKLLSDVYSDSFENKCALVIGVGKMGTLAIKNLCQKGMKKIYITNRSHCKAEDLSKIDKSLIPIDYNQRYSVIDECDIVISSTSSPHYTITKDMLEKNLFFNKKRVFIDLAVPRDFDDSVSELGGINYYNIDHLKAVMDKNVDKRQLAVAKAEEIIEECITDYEKWYEFRSVLDIVKDAQKYAEDVVNEKVKFTLSKLKYANEDEKMIVKNSITNTVNEILSKFLYSVKENGKKEDIVVYFKCLKDVLKVN